MNRRASSAGFTLLELVLAITIAALVVAVSAPSMQRLYSSSQYHSAVNDVVSALSLTRQQAIRSGQHADVILNPSERRIGRGDTITDLPEKVSLEVVGARELNQKDAGVIRFYPDGGSSGGYVTLTHENGMSVQVTVDWLLGRVSLCKSADCQVEI